MLKKYFMSIPKLNDRYAEKGQENQIKIIAKTPDAAYEERVVACLVGSISDWEENTEGAVEAATYCSLCRICTVLFDYLLNKFVCRECGSNFNAAYCNQCKTFSVLFYSESGEFVCRDKARHAAVGNRNLSEEQLKLYEELSRQPLTEEKEHKQHGFSIPFELAVYEELQSAKLDKEQSKNIARSIYVKIGEEIKIVGWHTKKSSQMSISSVIYNMLKKNRLPEDKISELLPKITDLADVFFQDVTYCPRCKGQTVIFDMIRSEFVCAACSWVVKDDYFNSEEEDTTPDARGKKETLRREK